MEMKKLLWVLGKLHKEIIILVLACVFGIEYRSFAVGLCVFVLLMFVLFVFYALEEDAESDGGPIPLSKLSDPRNSDEFRGFFALCCFFLACG